MHLSDIDIGVLLDRNRDPSARHFLNIHLATCTSCQRELAQFETTERLIGDSLHVLDVPLPRVTISDIRAATSAHIRPLHLPRRQAHRMAAAAAMLISTAAVAAVAARGPLINLITHALHRIGPRSIQPGAPAATQTRGVGIVPDSTIEVDFRTAQAVGEIHLTVGTEPHLLIQASADGPRYTVRHDGVAVENVRTDQASYDIEIPPPPTTVTVRIGDRTVYRRVGAQVIIPISVYRFAP